MIYDTLNPEVLKLILKSSKNRLRILDIGCGTGRLGKELKPRMDCFIVGVDIDREALDMAGKIYDKVIKVDLEKTWDKDSTPKIDEEFDCIVFGDILEHLVYPELLLRDTMDLLKYDGFIIASIPNIANWMVRIKLLFGNFDYGGGILDQGHLRSFTYKTARKLLEDNGYRVISVTNNNQTWPLRILGRLWKRMFAFQFVFKCVKKQY